MSRRAPRATCVCTRMRVCRWRGPDAPSSQSRGPQAGRAEAPAACDLRRVGRGRGVCLWPSLGESAAGPSAALVMSLQVTLLRKARPGLAPCSPPTNQRGEAAVQVGPPRPPRAAWLRRTRLRPDTQWAPGRTGPEPAPPDHGCPANRAPERQEPAALRTGFRGLCPFLEPNVCPQKIRPQSFCLEHPVRSRGCPSGREASKQSVWTLAGGFLFSGSPCSGRWKHSDFMTQVKHGCCG